MIVKLYCAITTFNARPTIALPIGAANAALDIFGTIVRAGIYKEKAVGHLPQASSPQPSHILPSAK